jgi:hypothetical protein
MKHDSLINILRERFADAVARVAETEPGEVDPVIRPAGDPKFGDYQCNVAMSLAKTLKSKPRGGDVTFFSPDEAPPEVSCAPDTPGCPAGGCGLARLALG